MRTRLFPFSAIAILLVLWSAFAHASPASRTRVRSLPPDAPLLRRGTDSIEGTLLATGTPRSLESISRGTTAPTVVIPRGGLELDAAARARIVKPAANAHVQLSIKPDGGAILLYTDHGVGIPIGVSGTIDPTTAVNLGKAANAKRREIPRAMTVNADSSVTVELLDGSKVTFTDSDFPLMPGPIVGHRGTRRGDAMARR